MNKKNSGFLIKVLILLGILSISAFAAVDSASVTTGIKNIVMSDMVKTGISSLLGLFGAWKIWDGIKGGHENLDISSGLLGAMAIGASAYWVDGVKAVVGWS
jgi:hypothetical protein